MKIAIYGLSNVFGGVERFILNIYEQLSDENTYFTFITESDNLEYLHLKKMEDKVMKYTRRSTNYFKHKKDLEDIFKNNNFDVLWFNCCSLSSIDELKCAHKYGVKKIIVHSHNGKNMGGRITYFLHIFNKLRLSRYATDFFACSDVAAKWMFSNKVLDKVNYINNAINAKNYTYNEINSKMLKKKYGLEDYTIVGHVGRFHTQKNHKYLIDIFQKYLFLNKNAILILCGDGSLKDNIISYVKSKQLTDHVIFMGNVSNINEMYQIFDLFLFPSLYEGLPFVLIEAQAAGIPCLISDVISKEIKITDLIYFESLNSNADDWANTLNLIKCEKKDTYKDICAAGYDLETNKKKIIELLNRS